MKLKWEHEPPGLGQIFLLVLVIALTHQWTRCIGDILQSKIKPFWGQKNAYDSKVQAVSTSPNCQQAVSEGYIHFIWSSESNGKKFFKICGNIG